MKKSLATPQQQQGRRSMLGFGSAAAKSRKQVPEQKRLTFSANKSRLQNSTMRSSRWSSQGAHPMKDPRPLSNRGFQKQMIDDILEFLNEGGYPHPITHKILSAPTTKEFLRVFEHLYAYMDSNFKMNKKFEEEVPKILKSINYPFTISKSAMFAIGSLHTWPTLLGALHWMVELIKTVNCIDIEEVLFQPSFNDDDISKRFGRTFLDFYVNTYALYMREEDDTQREQEELASTIITLAGCSAEDHQTLKEEVEDLERELALLQAEPDPLAEAIKTKVILEEKIEQDEIAIKELDQEMAVLKKQTLHYQRQLEEEGIFPRKLGDHSEEVRHKSTEVKRKLERLNNESERIGQQNNEREIRYCRMYDQISTSINEYNDTVKELMLHPHIRNYLGDTSIILHFDHNLTDVNDVKKRLKGVLMELSEYMSDQCYQIDMKSIMEEIQLQQNKEAISDKKDQIERLTVDIQSLDKELQENTLQVEQNLGKYKDFVEQEAMMQTKLTQLKATVKEEIECLEQKAKSVEKDEEMYRKTEEDFMVEIKKYCDKLRQYRQSVKNGMVELHKVIKGDISHLDQLEKTFENEP